MRAMGRGLQFLAMAILPVAVVLELSGALGRRFGVADLLITLAFAVAAFYLGRLIEGYARG